MANDATLEEELAPLPRPHHESLVVLPGGRGLGYAEYGDPDGDPVLWFHGTPGARKQVPPDGPALAAKLGIRLIGVERPGTGFSTPYVYRRVADWADDLERFADALGLDRFAVVGLSGGGPYVLAACHGLPDRVVAGCVLGGIGPTRGPEAAPGYTKLLPLIEPVLGLLQVPLGELMTHLIRPVTKVASQGYDLYTHIAPASDRGIMRRPEMKSMFIYDLVTACQGGLRAPVADLVVFGRDWGFSLRDIKVPVKFWHGDADGIVPLSHGEFQWGLVPNSEFQLCPGGGHFAGFILANEVFGFIDEHWPDRPKAARRAAAGRAGPTSSKSRTSSKPRVKKAAAKAAR
jgi:pimeloyl-ACP methyl ester carboxylesterase